ncbi:MAG: TetR family transcriptional regulator [Chloroflexi bacterium]|nr:TetR family transcriptional regulator [Chloroflexota bacterium]OJV89506.1 MAG: TetR family transcriptional regulator [Chloroflexi bacterium 54-19]
MQNAEATRERILEAALAEFSAYGVAGARVDRIAREAGCNKNLIYIYFESKENLFTTVLQKNLLRLYQEIAFNPSDLPGYAGRVFDYTLAHPDLMRLVAWTNLEQQAVTPDRLGVHSGKVEEIRQAQESGLVNPNFPPGFILIMVMTMANAWSASNPYGQQLEPSALQDPTKLRANIIEAVRLLTIVTG